MGPRAPHMLQSILVKITDNTKIILGLYGEHAAKGQAHNDGANSLPKRRFWGANAAELKQMGADIMARIDARLKQIT
jgi:hypothetical protein